ncbi:hypothetical protein T235_16380 [Tannerella sp. oral taxon BU063 isolate Cell 8/11]|jgi:hypothetical protein|uniref:Toxin-antitoxin system protein n=1 Tax=Tannerella sp. oral taxon BU063 isolate Cell 8/11 TaxID=1411915 RepID=W2CVP6_9BACT|nr:hypothetical protein T235_16380 [Tannerella sp. oral taxon BU063 isolate Cell 8/11]
MDTIELKETTSIRINKSLLDRMRAKAKAGNRTFSNLVETLLYEFDDAEDDSLISEKEYFDRIDAAKKSIEEGRFVEVRSKEELHRYLDSL